MKFEQILPLMREGDILKRAHTIHDKERGIHWISPKNRFNSKYMMYCYMNDENGSYADIMTEDEWKDYYKCNMLDETWEIVK